MKASSIISLVISILFIVNCGEAPNKDIAIADSKKNLNTLSNYINQHEKDGLYGSFLLMENDTVLFEKSVGYSNKEKEIKSHKNTIYPYGSITKDYTRTIILLLAAERKLDIEDNLSKYYPNIPNDKKNITIAQLLQHKSGLLTYHDNIPELREKYKGIPADLYPGSKEDALGYIFSQTLQFEPGTDELYSNSGYTLLAYLIEDITGKGFDEVVKEKIFIPAGMTSADFYSSPKWKPEDVAVGYGRSSYGKENSAYYWPRNPNQLIGNGGIAGTLIDLYKGLKYMMHLEESNESFRKLSKKYKYIEDMPEDIVGSSGGGNLGNVAVLFGIKSKNQYLLFASNNDDDGMEDVTMLRQVTLLGFDFDIASLAPEEFKENGGNEESEKSALKSDEETSKWGLPLKPKYNKISALLDLISDEIDLETFKNEHCNTKTAKKVEKIYKKWPKSKTIKFKELVSYGTEMEITIKDSISNESYVFEIKLDGADDFKFKSISFKD